MVLSQRIISFLQPWKQSNRFSIKHKVPVFGGSTEMIAMVGGLYNYGTNYEELGRQTARMLIRVLKVKPENIAVELPEKLELHTNKENGQKLLGIDISEVRKKE